MRAGMLGLGLFSCVGDKGGAAEPDSGGETLGCVFASDEVEPAPIHALYSSEDGEIWASNGGTSLCRDLGDGWRTLALPASATNGLGLGGVADRVYTRDGDGLFRYDGAWGEIRPPEDAEIDRFVVHATGALSTLGMVESDCCEDCTEPYYAYQILRFDGAGWDGPSELGTGAPLWAMTELGGTLVLVGDGGLILREQGSGWATVDAGTGARLRDATAVGGELVAVGDGGVVVSGPLDDLSMTTLDPSQDLLAVRAEPGGVLWILAGAAGAEAASAVIRVEAGAWTAIDVGVGGLTTLAVAGTDDVVVGGWDAGAVIARGGTAGFEVVVDGPG